jgi:hypothetical protein
MAKKQADKAVNLSLRVESSDSERSTNRKIVHFYQASPEEIEIRKSFDNYLDKPLNVNKFLKISEKVKVKPKLIARNISKLETASFRDVLKNKLGFLHR